MSHHFNQAALDYWKSVSDKVDGPLRQTVKESLGDDRYVDVWLERMVQNARDTADDDEANFERHLGNIEE